MIELANLATGPFANITAKAVEVGVVVPSILLDELESAGYEVKYYSGPKDSAAEGDAPVGAWVKVWKGKELVARAYSHDVQDAMLQAIYAAMKEEQELESLTESKE